MKNARSRTKLTLAAAIAALLALILPLGQALAAGTLTYASRELKESGGGWRIAMTINYGSMPTTPHVPFSFTFTPTAIYERFLDDAHKDVPQTRKIPLTGQVPIVESIDVDFADSRGKMYDRTKFDFTITRSHNFVAGEYSVTVRRADGQQVGTPQTLVLNGENTVIDRRAISFVAGGKKDKDKDKDKDKAAQDPSGDKGEKKDDKAAPAADTAPAGEGPGASGDGDKPAVDPVAGEKVPPAAHGCGCRTAGTGPSGAASGAGVLLGLAALVSRRRRARHA